MRGVAPERIVCPWPSETTPGPTEPPNAAEREATLYPAALDLEVWASYQMSVVRQARHRTRTTPPPRARIALARILIALATLLQRPEPDVASPPPRYQPF